MYRKYDRVLITAGEYSGWKGFILGQKKDKYVVYVKKGLFQSRLHLLSSSFRILTKLDRALK